MMLQINAHTKLIGLLGYPVEHSFSPVMQNAAFQELGLNYVYLAFPVSPGDLAAVLKALPAMGIAGVNVTVPHKEAVIPCLDEISPEAVYAGAVNTIVNKDGRLVGYNTDGIGFCRSLETEAGVKPEGKTFLLLGAGGACRAIASVFAFKGARRIYIANRNFSRAIGLAEDINRIRNSIATHARLIDGELVPISKECDAVINTTTVGMFPRTNESPLADPASVLKPGQVVCDLIYNPPKTLLLMQAEQMGCSILSGEGMLLYQGAEAFRLWTGEEPPVDLMRKALKQHLTKIHSNVDGTTKN
ncbi:hypothetical protein SY88_17620 [Clostridiales bacterium PH28_bin88]|nr:hypothetical protein SY88_17620 [Clostridiales bacterium PH28_bin88]